MLKCQGSERKIKYLVFRQKLLLWVKESFSKIEPGLKKEVRWVKDIKSSKKCHVYVLSQAARTMVASHGI